jgi:hypothetical protein
MVFLDDSLVDKMAPLPRGVGRVKDGHVSFSALQVVQRIVQRMLTCQKRQMLLILRPFLQKNLRQ